MKYIHKVSGYTAVSCDTLPEHYDIWNKQYVHRGYLPDSIIEGSKDWELQIEKDYEILSFKSNKGLIAHKTHDGNFNYDITTQASWTESDLINEIPIHSVKRISDQEVFQLGDNTEDGKIESFDVDARWTSGIAACCPSSGTKTSLGSVVKRQVLFTTEDGVEIYDGDSAFLISGDSFLKVLYVASELSSKNSFSSNNKRFSTKAAAQEYLDKEKKISMIRGIMISCEVEESDYSKFHKTLAAMGQLYDTLTKQPK